MEDALNHVQQLAAISDSTSRRRIMSALHNLAFSLEDAHDTINRLGYLHLQTATVKIGFDLGLFKFLVREEGALTLDDISQKTRADPVFLGISPTRSVHAKETNPSARYLRYLASIAVIEEVGKDGYTANNITRNLAQPVAEAGISHW